MASLTTVRRWVGDSLAVLGVAAIPIALGVRCLVPSGAAAGLVFAAAAGGYLLGWSCTQGLGETIQRWRRLPLWLPMSVERICVLGLCLAMTTLLIVATAVLPSDARAAWLVGLGGIVLGVAVHRGVTDRPVRGESVQAGASHPGFAPLESSNQDWFGILAPMVAELEEAWQAGFENQQNRPQGATIVVIGEWGSGKTSLLKVFADELDHRSRDQALAPWYQDLVIVPWTPWELHDPGDIVRHFAGALASRLNGRWFVPNVVRRARSHARAVTQIKGLPSPFAEVAESIGSLIPDDGAAPVLASAFRPQMEELFTNLRAARGGPLSEYRGGVVLIIDEVDRLELDEMRAVLRCIGAAQHVPWLSIIVAVEPERLMEALAARIGASAAECNPARLEQESAKFFHRAIFMRAPSVG